MIGLIYRQDLTNTRFAAVAELSEPGDQALLRKSMIAAGLMVVALVAGMPVPLAGLAAAMILLVTRRIDPEEILPELDWSLLVFFSGLFIVTGALESLGVSRQLFTLVQPLAKQGVAMLTVVAVVLSNLISNVPAVLLFRPFIPQFATPTLVWLTLAMATTLAGNLTLLGSVANLIVAESAKRQGVELSFQEYLKAGIPITLLSLAFGVLWLLWIF